MIKLYTNQAYAWTLYIYQRNIKFSMGLELSLFKNIISINKKDKMNLNAFLQDQCSLNSDHSTASEFWR